MTASLRCRHRLMASALCLAALAAVYPVTADERTPKLVVLLVVDQFRADYVDKLQQQWHAGLKRLIAEGAWFRRAQYPYYGTVTCAGHASISTGSVPAIHGMIANEWWDRGLRKEVTCTDDATATTVSFGAPVRTEGESMRRLRAATLADELRAQLV